MSQSYKKHGDEALFGKYYRLKKLSEQGDPLEKLDRVTDWTIFLPILEKTLNTEKESKAGAKPYDLILMFKILILQRYYNLSDEQTQYQILDRLSFCRFLGLSLDDKVPDEKTIWDFRERLTSAGLEAELFEAFAELLARRGLIAHQGQLMDASFVEVPRQRNTRTENKTIKGGKVPTEWEDKPNKKRQKDTDARWTKKNGETYYGYKDHLKVDNKYKLIQSYSITDAATHDSQELEELLDETDGGQTIHADSAYTGADQQQTIADHQMVNKVHQKGYRNRPLSEGQKQLNRHKSRTRARVEHVFGFPAGSMNQLYARCIGAKRAEGVIGLINLTYNMFRVEQLVRLHGIAIPTAEINK
jgi:IS5 family transposase